MQTADTLLQDLTEPQRQAVTHVDGPLLIIAAAGSGKTRVITRRVAHLIAQGAQPNSILAITFTNKAAGEMKSRIGDLLRRSLRDFGKLDQPWPTICTFHSLCLRILRHYAATIGLGPNFSIYDSADQTKLLKDALKLLDLSTSNFPPASVHSTISNAKNQLLTAELFASQGGDFHRRTVARVYTKYQAMLKQNNALDFDDLLLQTALAFRDHPQILRELQERFSYILIDEYQDTNHAQYVVAHALALRHRNMCVVGDPDQSIYAWRGADIQNILDFEKDYPDALVVRLEQNYRSTKTILAIASQLISRNKIRREKDLWTENVDGAKARLLLCQDERDEAATVAAALRELHDQQGVPWNGMAIFYRMNSLSRVMEDALRSANVPYVMARGVEFYNRKEIKDVLAYLRSIANPNDEVSLERIVNVPTRGVGDATVKVIRAFAIQHGLGLYTAMEQAGTIPGLSKRAVNAAGIFTSQINKWRGMVQAQQPPQQIEFPQDDNDAAEPDADSLEVADKIAEFSLLPPVAAPETVSHIRAIMEAVVRDSGLEAMYRKAGGEETGESGAENINALISGAAEYDTANPAGTLSDYLNMISLVSDVDHLQGNGGAITMMTLHAAKGLEFPVVAIIGLEEGVLPHARSRTNPPQMEEERRLCFVGITRAMERLILSKANYRTNRGLRERTATSPFLVEMPQDHFELTDRCGIPLHGEDRTMERELAQTEAQRTSSRFQRGQQVRHPRFGIGTIKEVSNMGQHTRAEVDFLRVGKKTLILEYAQLEPV